jgi:tetratricopeptide (TPR) repeat protein
MRLSRNAISTFGLLAALSCAPTWCAADTQYVQWGNKMLQQKNYDSAIQYFGGAIKADGKDAAAYKGLGYAYAYKNDKAKALQYLKYSLQLNPSDSALQAYVTQLDGGSAAPAAGGGAAQALQYGNYYYQQKNYDAAVGWYTKATQADASNAKAWQALGNGYYGKGDKPDAINAWNKAVALDPSNTQLAAYVNQLQGAATASSAPAASTQAEAPATVSTPGVNPWIMGATVAALGAVMLFVF